MMIGMKMRPPVLNPKIRWHGAPKFLTCRVKTVEFYPGCKALMAQAEVNCRKISRKRFERIAMALGVVPRTARWIADGVNAAGLEYKDALRGMITALNTNELEGNETREE